MFGLKPLELDIPGDRHQRSRKIGVSPAEANRSSTDITLGIKRLLRNQMVRAKRAGTWFRLCGRERAFISLSLRLNIKFQSYDLFRALVSVLKSLRQTCDRGYMALMKAVRIAWAFSEAAVRAGNERAREWRNDRAYITYLAAVLK